MKKWLLSSLLFCVLLSGCKICECLPEIEYRDSIHTEYKLDSIYLYERDSIYLDRSKDTIYKEVWKWRYKDKIVMQIDTLLVDHEVVQTETIKYTPAFYKWCAGILIGLIVLLIAIGAIKLYARFRV